MKHFPLLLCLALLSLNVADAEAMDRRSFLRGLLAVGTAPLVPPTILGTSATTIVFNITQLERDLAEIINIQRGMVQIPPLNSSILEQKEGFIRALKELELITPEGQAARKGLVSQLEAGIRAINSGGIDRLNTPREKVSELQTNRAIKVFDKLSISLVYNIVMIRSLLSPRLLMKINAQIGFEASNIRVTTEDFLFLIDYYQLLELNVERFDLTDPGYLLLEELLVDAKSWFSRLELATHSLAPPRTNLTCKARLL